MRDASAPSMSSALTRLCLSTLLTMLGFAAITPVMAVQLSQQGYSPAKIGIFSALVYAGVWLVAPFQPQLAARFGKLSSYQFGKILTILASLGLSHAHGTGMWASLLLLLGMGGALVWPPTDALVADHAPSSKEGSVTGLYHTGIAADPIHRRPHGRRLRTEKSPFWRDGYHDFEQHLTAPCHGVAAWALDHRAFLGRGGRLSLYAVRAPA